MICLTLTKCTSVLDVVKARRQRKQLPVFLYHLVSAQHVINRTLYYSTNVLYCNYGRRNLKVSDGSEEQAVTLPRTQNKYHFFSLHANAVILGT